MAVVVLAQSRRSSYYGRSHCRFGRRRRRGPVPPAAVRFRHTPRYRSSTAPMPSGRFPRADGASSPWGP